MDHSMKVICSILVIWSAFISASAMEQPRPELFDRMSACWDEEKVEPYIAAKTNYCETNPRHCEEESSRICKDNEAQDDRPHEMVGHYNEMNCLDLPEIPLDAGRPNLNTLEGKLWIRYGCYPFYSVIMTLKELEYCFLNEYYVSDNSSHADLHSDMLWQEPIVDSAEYRDHESDRMTDSESLNIVFKLYPRARKDEFGFWVHELLQMVSLYMWKSRDAVLTPAKLRTYLVTILQQKPWRARPVVKQFIIEHQKGIAHCVMAGSPKRRKDVERALTCSPVAWGRVGYAYVGLRHEGVLYNRYDTTKIKNAKYYCIHQKDRSGFEKKNCWEDCRERIFTDSFCSRAAVDWLKSFHGRAYQTEGGVGNYLFVHSLGFVGTGGVSGLLGLAFVGRHAYEKSCGTEAGKTAVCWTFTECYKYTFLHGINPGPANAVRRYCKETRKPVFTSVAPKDDEFRIVDHRVEQDDERVTLHTAMLQQIVPPYNNGARPFVRHLKVPARGDVVLPLVIDDHVIFDSMPKIPEAEEPRLEPRPPHPILAALAALDAPVDEAARSRGINPAQVLRDPVAPKPPALS